MAKLNPADAEAQSYMQLQRRTAVRCRAADLILILVLSAMIAVLGIAIFILPQSTFSEDENRSLTTFPSFSLKALVSGDWTADVTEFYSDQFPVRRTMVQLKAACELAQLKGQNNGVLLGANDTLISRLEYNDATTAEANLAAIEQLREALDGDGIPVSTLIVPRSIDVLAAELPALYGSERSDAIWDVINAHIADAGRLCDRLRELSEAGEYVWYRTDHHWTTDGAYTAYVMLGEVLGYRPYAADEFERVLAASDFYGTTYSSSGMYFVQPDEMYFYRYGGDDSYVVENMLTGKCLSGFYDLEQLAGKDKYSAFIGGNNAHMRVYDTSAGAAEKPTLILVKDSYAHALVPFLARHYDLEIIDLRSYTGSVAKLAREKGACGVLVLTGVDNLATSDSLTLLRYGLTTSKN